jgi:conjugal transfer pilus assembly protein TraL
MKQLMSKQIPRYCDEMLQVGPIEADELGVILAALAIGILIDQMLWAILVAFVVPKALGHFKGNNPRGFLIHFLYWYGVTDFKGLFSESSYTKNWVK